MSAVFTLLATAAVFAGALVFMALGVPFVSAVVASYVTLYAAVSSARRKPPCDLSQQVPRPGGEDESPRRLDARELDALRSGAYRTNPWREKALLN